uniref:Uncharacterized protein n=1 Tax=Tanacetum cinerariifolium TaxID=118510 RepID=A0A6L2J6Q4_TANCI|nr:hypothetical protein [Tanacetum cinerariifolium]
MTDFNSTVRAFVSLGHDLGNSYVYDPNLNSFDFPPNSYHPPHPTYATYSYDSYGNNSQFGYDCQPQFQLNYESEPGYNENYNSYPYDSSSLPHQYLCFSRYLSTSSRIEYPRDGGFEAAEKLLQQEQWAYLSTHPSKRLHSFCFDDDDDKGYTSAITPDEPVLSTEEPDNSLCIGDEHLDTIPATKSDEFIKSGVENLSPIPSESEGIPEHMCDVPFHDNSPPLDASPPDPELVSSEVMEIVILEFETFYFDVEEISSGSTTTPPDISLPEYEAFHDDHVKEISSGSPTTHSDSSLYASFIFSLSINPFPPTDRSDSYEFTNELIPFIPPTEYDCFLFKVEANSRDFTMDVVEDISPTKEPQVLNTLPTHPTLQLNLKFQPSSEYLFTYVVWIFLPFLVYSVASHYLLSLRNEDTIFDLDIFKSTFSRPDISHRYGTIKKFNTYRSHLNKFPMLIHGQNNPPLDVLLFHFYPP